MSLHFRALLARSRPDVGVESLVENLALNPPALASFAAEYEDRWGPKAWQIADPTRRGDAVISGPEFSIHLEPGIVRVYHARRFSAFTSDASYRNRLRRVCLYIANLVGSERAIYTHELLPSAGESLDEIETGLRAKFGPAANSFEELDEAKDYGPGSWYVDDFADLKT